MGKVTFYVNQSYSKFAGICSSISYIYKLVLVQRPKQSITSIVEFIGGKTDYTSGMKKV